MVYFLISKFKLSSLYTSALRDTGISAGMTKFVVPAGFGNAPTMEVRFCLAAKQNLTSTSYISSQTPTGTWV